MEKDLLQIRAEIEKTASDMMERSTKYAEGLRRLRQLGYSERGVIDKCVEITAIQAEQIRFLASIALYTIRSFDFTKSLAEGLAMQHEENNKQ